MSATIFKDLFEKFLQDKMTPEEFRRFRTMARDPTNRKALDRLLAEAYRLDPNARTLSSDEGEIDLIFDELMAGTIRQKPPVIPVAPRGMPFRQHRAKFMAAALLLPILSVGLFFYYHNKTAGPGEITTISTQRGERKNITLPDGSQVRLNAGSILTLQKGFNDRERMVGLSGEAYFDIAKNENLPFIIHTSSMNIKVLGTVFDVRCYPEESNEVASLIRGKIMVSVNKGREQTEATDYYLLPLQKLVIQKDNPDPEKPAGATPPLALPSGRIDSLRMDRLIDQLPETAWTENKLFFNADSLGEVVGKIEKWYGVEVRLDNKTIEHLHFTGSYRNESLQRVMEALHLANPELNYRLENKDKLLVLY